MPDIAKADDLLLLIDGRPYSGWTSARITRRLRRCFTDFDIGVTERWLGQDEPWQIKPFARCEIRIGGDRVLTGYVNDYDPAGSKDQASVRIAGGSKTEDLTDCTADLKSGQFAGYSVAAIARAVCAPFGIGVIVRTDAADQTVANSNLERCEKAWGYIERLCRLAGVLATDDASGNLVLTRAGEARSSGRLVHGENIERYSGKLTSRGRFSDYITLGQAGIGGGGSAGWGGAGGIGQPTTASAGAVQTQQRAQAHDADVPRYRPHISIAESQLTLAQMQQRVDWQRSYAFGQSISAHITVAGWRQPDGRLWQVNELIPVNSRRLGVDQDLLIASVSFGLSTAGHETTLEVAPIEGYTPDPGEVKLHKHKGNGHGGSGVNWTGAGGDIPDAVRMKGMLDAARGGTGTTVTIEVK